TGATIEFTPAPANDSPMLVPGALKLLNRVPIPVDGSMVTTSPEPSCVKPKTLPRANATPKSFGNPVEPTCAVTCAVAGSIFTSRLSICVPFPEGSASLYAVPYIVPSATATRSPASASPLLREPTVVTVGGLVLGSMRQNAPL